MIRRWTVWAIVVATVLAMLADTVLFLRYPSGRLAAPGWPVLSIGSLLSVAVGVAILRRYPSHRIGWLFLVAGLTTEVSTLVYRYVYLVLDAGELASTTNLARYATLVAVPLDAVLPGAVLTLLFLLFPDGHAMSRRWSLLAWVMSVLAALYVAVELAVVRPSQVRSFSELGLGTAQEAVLDILLLAVLAGTILSALGLVIRVRRARGVQRQQLRWLAAAAAGLALGLLLAVLWPSANEANYLRTLPLHLAFAALPVAAGFAVLRYRLYDLDVIISGAVVGAVLVGFVTIGYVAVVVTLGAVAGGATPFWVSVLATAVVALAFQPIRRWADRLAKRVAYGERAAPYEALASLNEQLAASLAIGELLPRVAEKAARTVDARRSDVSLDVPGTVGVHVGWPYGDPAPRPGESTVRLAVTHAGRELGAIALVLPPGRALSRDERRMLADFAGQCGVAFRNAQLAAALQARSAQLARDADSIAASRARLAEAATTERRRLARAIGRDVITFLDPLDSRLEQASAQLPDQPSQAMRDLDEAAADTGSALEQLRSLTRGVFPPTLTRRGVAAAIAAELDRAGLADGLAISGQARDTRYDDRAEVALYFCFVEAVGELVPPIAARLEEVGGAVELRLDGALAAGVEAASDLRLVVDRAEALGGTADVTLVGRRVVILVRIPVLAAQPVTTTRHAAASVSGPKEDLGT
jgi:signal transduction histidine kinase